MTGLLVWPHRLFVAKTQGWTIQGASVEGGRPLSGNTPQRDIFGGGGYNAARLKSIRIRTREQLSAWQAIEAILDNGANPIIVPVCERRLSPLPSGSSSILTPFSDGTPYHDGSLHMQGQTSALVTAVAAFRDTTLSFTLKGGRPLIGAEKFTIRHPTVDCRLYRVAQVLSSAPITGGFAYTVTFRPTLREAVLIGDEIDFDYPRCVMRLADAAGMDIDVDLRKFADASVSFVEDFKAMQAYT